MKKISICISCLIISSCASITDGTSQTIIFTITPNEAICKLTREGSELGSVSSHQNTISVSKGAKDIIITCKADGYVMNTQRLVSKTQTSGVVGGAFLDLGITDMLTGAMWKYPNEVSVIMERDKPATSAVTK